MMVSIAIILVVVTTIVSALYFLFGNRKRKNMPPGPRPIPIFGTAHKVGPTRHPHKVFADWSKEYNNPLISVKLGSFDGVVMNDYKLIRDAFNNPNIIGRPDNRAFNEFAGGRNGVLAAEGNIWTEQRRFTLRHLRDFGFGKNQMESLIMDEVTELIDNFKKEEGQPIAIHRRFNLAILNAIWVILTGNRNSHDDPRIARILEELFQQFNEVTASGVLFFLPFLIKLFPEWSGWNKFKQTLDNAVNLFREIIIEHKETVQEGSPRDFIDSHLLEIKKTTDKTSSFYKEIGEQNLVAIIGDMFAAGAETTATTLTWSMLYLTKNLEVQRRLQKEIDSVIGKTRLPTLADRANMPYTEAIMYEVLRHSSIVALGLMHTSTADVLFHGYNIPKDTYFIPNLYYVHHDPDVWGDPENFRPDRFLSTDKKTVQKPESLIAFSTGKRACLGEQLAKDEFFLFLTNIFQRFNVELDANSKEVSTEPVIGFLLAPKPFKVVMNDRLH